MTVPENRTRTGFTLVEVLVALTLVAMVLLPVVLGLSQALVSTSESTMLAAATSIARQKMEDLKSEIRDPTKGFDAVVSQEREPADLNPGDSFFEVAVTVETTRPQDSADSGMKKAVVTVYRAGSERPLTVLTTYLVVAGV